MIGRDRGDPALEELLTGCYRPQSADDPVGALQVAIDQLGRSHPQLQKLQAALKSGQLRPAPGEPLADAALAAGLLDAEEAREVRAAEAARRRVIDVDDFSREELHLREGGIR